MVEGVLRGGHGAGLRAAATSSARGPPAQHRAVRERAYGPDIHVAHRTTHRTTSNHLDGEGLCFVAELTSVSTRLDDLTDKVGVYGNAGVPVYLALDMQEERASVFWGPYEKGYKSRLTRPFGEKLYIPDPFGCELDTAGFQAPSAEG